MDIPVYLFTGFLEAGKTRFIQETMEDERFNTGEKTLILVCEEGIEEYDPSRFCCNKVYLEPVEQESDLSPAFLQGLLKTHGARRVLVEYNGMWQLKSLFEALPDNWIVAQEFCFAEAATFLNYNQNMRSLVADKLSGCELVVFNRFDPKIDKMELHRFVRALNTRADIAFEYPNGSVEYDEIEDPLPFDRDAEIITVEDKDYAYFYRDLSENLDFYNNKTVCFKCVTAKNKELKENERVVGRHIMTCCVEDITFAGFLLIGDHLEGLQNRDWATVTARVRLENHPLYGRRGPVLYLEKYESAELPETEVATFY